MTSFNISRFHYGLKVPVVTITEFLTILGKIGIIVVNAVLYANPSFIIVSAERFN
jgi:hypothetical protein